MHLLKVHGISLNFVVYETKEIKWVEIMPQPVLSSDIYMR
jgi:hypothetical protein